MLESRDKLLSFVQWRVWFVGRDVSLEVIEKSLRERGAEVGGLQKRWRKGRVSGNNVEREGDVERGFCRPGQFVRPDSDRSSQENIWQTSECPYEVDRADLARILLVVVRSGRWKDKCAWKFHGQLEGNRYVSSDRWSFMVDWYYWGETRRIFEWFLFFEFMERDVRVMFVSLHELSFFLSLVIFLR